MRVILFEQVVLHIEPKLTKLNDMVMITLLNLQKRFSCLEQREYVHGFTPVLQSTRKDCRQESEDYLNSGHTLS